MSMIRFDPTKMGKKEEIEFLEKLKDSFKASTNYLENLFSDKLVDWASDQIKNDFPCDIMADFEDGWEKVGRLETKINNMESFHSGERQNEHKKMEAMAQLIESQKVSITKQQDHIDAQYVEIQRLRNEVDRLRGIEEVWKAWKNVIKAACED